MVGSQHTQSGELPRRKCGCKDRITRVVEALEGLRKFDSGGVEIRPGAQPFFKGMVVRWSDLTPIINELREGEDG